MATYRLKRKNFAMFGLTAKHFQGMKNAFKNSAGAGSVLKEAGKTAWHGGVGLAKGAGAVAGATALGAGALGTGMFLSAENKANS